MYYAVLFLLFFFFALLPWPCAQVTKVMARLASVDIMCVDSKSVRETFTGIIRWGPLLLAETERLALMPHLNLPTENMLIIAYLAELGHPLLSNREQTPYPAARFSPPLSLIRNQGGGFGSCYLSCFSVHKAGDSTHRFLGCGLVKSLSQPLEKTGHHWKSSVAPASINMRRKKKSSLWKNFVPQLGSFPPAQLVLLAVNSTILRSLCLSDIFMQELIIT